MARKRTSVTRDGTVSPAAPSSRMSSSSGSSSTVPKKKDKNRKQDDKGGAKAQGADEAAQTPTTSTSERENSADDGRKRKKSRNSRQDMSLGKNGNTPRSSAAEKDGGDGNDGEKQSHKKRRSTKISSKTDDSTLTGKRKQSGSSQASDKDKQKKQEMERRDVESSEEKKSAEADGGNSDERAEGPALALQPNSTSCTPETGEKTAEKEGIASVSGLTSALTPETPVASSENENPQRDKIRKQSEGHKASIRRAHIKAVLQHRKLLLDRIKQSRKAAEARVKTLPKISHQQEKDEFKALAKEAMSKKRAAASPVSGGSQQQKQTKRKSSRVHKKSPAGRDQFVYQDGAPSAANAASSRSSPASMQPLVPSGQTPGKALRRNISSGKLADSNMNRVQQVPGTLASNSQVSGVAMVSSSTIPGMIPSGISQPPGSVGSSPNIFPGTAVMQHTGPKNSKTMSHTLKSSKRGSSSNLFSMDASSTSHPGSALSTPHTKPLPLITTVNPEVVALRERRKEILAKLQQKHNIEASPSEKPGTSTGTTPSMKSTDSGRLHDIPSNVPPRRKTQWDYVMEEMRWLSADFLEERKWKRAAARTLASAIANNHRKGEKSQAQLEGQPSASDLKHAKSVAAVISSTVLGHWSALIDGGAQADEGKELSQRQDVLLKKYLHDLQPAGDDPSEAEAAWCRSNAAKEGMSSSMHEECAKRPLHEMAGDTSCDIHGHGTEWKHDEATAVDGATEIKMASQAADQFRSTLGTLDKRDALKAQLGVKGCGVELMLSQLRALRWIEYLWAVNDSVNGQRRKPTGAVLGGSLGAGKTVATGCLLWKHRNCGPQLVLCAPQSLIRWRYELRRFSEIHAFGLGFHGGSYDPTKKALRNVSSAPCKDKLDARDVLVCDFGSLMSGNETILPLISTTKWSSIVVDIRHTSLVDKIDSTLTVTGSAAVSPPAGSRAWWKCLLKILSPKDRLCGRVIVAGGWDKGVRHWKSDEALAKTVAVVHPFAFESSIFKVFKWAKTSSPEVDSLHKVLLTAVEPFQFDLEEDEVSNASHKLVSPCEMNGVQSDDNRAPVCRSGPPSFKWEIRPCTMEVNQKSSYRRCCKCVRGSLGINTQRVFPNAAAEALLKLRRVCFHANIDGMLRSLVPAGLSSRDLFSDRESALPAWTIGSSASPQIEVAEALIRGSGKMRELLSILVGEVGVTSSVEMDATTGEMHRRLTIRVNKNDSNGSSVQVLEPGKDTSTKEPSLLNEVNESRTPVTTPRSFCSAEAVSSKDENQKKILILAALPEIQLLLHCFLNACGIPHGMLGVLASEEFTTPYGASYAAVDSESQFAGQCLQAFSWSEAQRTLASFNMFGNMTDGACDIRSDTLRILISSPAIVGGAEGGLSAGAVDMIISVDEDWSGRGEKLLESIVRRCDLHQETVSKKVHLIKLISRATCEESFLSESTIVGAEEQAKAKKVAVVRADSNEKVEEKETLEKSAVEKQNEYDPSFVEVQTDPKGFISGAINKASGKPHAFLAGRILRFRDRKLSAVLCVSLAHHFFSRKEPLFLPSEIVQSRATSSLGADAMHNPLSSVQKSVERSVPLKEEALSFGEALAAAEVSACFLSSVKRKNGGLEKIRPTSCLSTPVLPGKVANRRDVFYMETRRHCEWYGKVSQAFGNSLELVLDGSHAARELDTGKELAEAWHRAGFGCHPGDQSLSLLFYKMSSSSIQRKKPAHDGKRSAHSHGDSHEAPPSKRSKGYGEPRSACNLYATAYTSNAKQIRDGHQYLEPLVYTPPLLPGIRSVQRDANPRSLLTKDVSDTKADDLGWSDKGETNVADLAPLADSDFEPSSASELVNDDAAIKELSTADLDMSLGELLSFDDPCVTGLDSVVGQKAVNDIMEGAVALPSENTTGAMDELVSVLPAISADLPSSSNTKGGTSSVTADALDEETSFDFGLLGNGVLPGTGDSLNEALETPMGTADYISFMDPFDPDPPIVPLDADDSLNRSVHYMDSMLLLVNRPGVSSEATVAGALQSQTSNKKSSVKKHKKQNSNTTLTPETNLGVTLMEVAPGNLSTSATDGDDLPDVRARIEEHVCFSFSKQDQSEPTPIHDVVNSKEKPRPSKASSLSFVRCVLTGRTEEKDYATATSQRAELESSAVMPKDVDFGPFGSGHLARSQSMVCCKPAFSKAGISLPMGVKVNHRETCISDEPWSDADDQAVKDMALKYCFNWHLVSLAITNESHTRSSYGAKSVMVNFVRSARQCRERWRHLASSDPSIAKEANEKDRLDRRMGAVSRYEVPRALHDVICEATKGQSGQMRNIQTSATGRKVILPKTCDGKNETGNTAKIDSSSQTQDRFRFLRSSASRKHVPASFLPGSAEDPRSPLAPSHSSHSMAIQEVISSFGGHSGGGPVHMWPLQLLDFADKQRLSSSTLHQSTQSQKFAQPTKSSVAGISSQQQTPAPASHVNQSYQPPQRNHMMQVHPGAKIASTPSSSAVKLPQTSPPSQVGSSPPSSNMVVAPPHGQRILASSHQEQIKQAARAAALAPSTKAGGAKGYVSVKTAPIPHQTQLPAAMAKQHHTQTAGSAAIPTSTTPAHYNNVGVVQPTQMQPSSTNRYASHAGVAMPNTRVPNVGASAVGGAPQQTAPNPLAARGTPSLGVSPMRSSSNNSSSQGRK